MRVHVCVHIYVYIYMYMNTDKKIFLPNCSKMIFSSKTYT